MTTFSETARGEGVAFGRSGLRTALVAFGLTIVAALVITVAFVLGLVRTYEGRIVPGVQVGGVQLAGLDRASAELKLRESLPSLSAGKLELVVDGRRRAIPYASLGRDYDLEAMLDEAYAIGRNGGGITQTIDLVRSLVRPTTIDPRARYDAPALERLLAAEAAALAVRPRDASAVLGPDGRFAVKPGADGRRVDAAGAASLAGDALASTDPGDSTVNLTSTRVEPGVTTAEAKEAVALAEAMSRAGVQLTTGRQAFPLPAAEVRRWLSFGPTPDGGYGPRVVQSRVGAAVKRLAPKVDRSPRDAAFVTRGTRIIGVTPAVGGRRLDRAATTRRVSAALGSFRPGSPAPRVALAVAASAPQLSTEEARALAPKMRRISTWTTYYPVGEKNFWGKNITIPTSAIDGHVLMPGQWFDFWEVVGEVSRAKGYGAGGAIINGRTEPTGALAGGICSCSTTIFNAALRAGLEMGARRNHYYYISRYPKGLDATVFKSSGSTQTMSFRNDTANPILIRGINGYGRVTFQLYSVPTGRKVTFSAPIVRNFRPASDSVEYTTDLPAGKSKRVEYPVDGFDAWVTRWVRDASGKVIHKETYFSRYSRITGVVLVGRG